MAALRSVASISQESLPCTWLHASRHHRLHSAPYRVRSPGDRFCAASRSQAVHTWQVVKAVPTSASGPASSKYDLAGEPPAPLGAHKISLLSTAQNFLPLRGLTRWRLAAQETFEGGARKKKWMENRAGAESMRLVALVLKIKVRGPIAAPVPRWTIRCCTA